MWREIKVERHDWPVSVLINGIAIDAGGRGFDSATTQIGRRVTNCSPPLRCFFGAVLPRRCVAEIGPVKRFGVTSTASTIQIRFFCDEMTEVVFNVLYVAK